MSTNAYAVLDTTTCIHEMVTEFCGYCAPVESTEHSFGQEACTTPRSRGPVVVLRGNMIRELLAAAPAGLSKVEICEALDLTAWDVAGTIGDMRRRMSAEAVTVVCRYDQGRAAYVYLLSGDEADVAMNGMTAFRRAATIVATQAAMKQTVINGLVVTGSTPAQIERNSYKITFLRTIHSGLNHMVCEDQAVIAE